MTFYVYILYSPSFDKYYVGQTDNLGSRLIRHNKGYENFTSKYTPWNLVWFATKDTRSEALQLEAKLKNLSKLRLIKFIEKYK